MIWGTRNQQRLTSKQTIKRQHRRGAKPATDRGEPSRSETADGLQEIPALPEREDVVAAREAAEAQQRERAVRSPSIEK